MKGKASFRPFKGLPSGQTVTFYYLPKRQSSPLFGPNCKSQYDKWLKATRDKLIALSHQQGCKVRFQRGKAYFRIGVGPATPRMNLKREKLLKALQKLTLNPLRLR